MKRKKKGENEYYLSLLFRGLAILVVTLNFNLIYTIFTPITVYLSYYLTSLFYDTIQIGNSIGVGGIGFNIINACVAGAAYYLLFLLILGLKDLSFKKGIKMLLSGFAILLVANVLRIFLLIVLNIEFGENYFEAVHLAFWNFISGIFIFLIWIFLVKKFKERDIPYWSDIKYLYSKSSLKNSKSKVNKRHN